MQDVINEIRFLDGQVEYMAHRRKVLFERMTSTPQKKEQVEPVPTKKEPDELASPLHVLSSVAIKLESPPSTPPLSPVLYEEKPVVKKRKKTETDPKEDGRRKRKKADDQSFINRKNNGLCMQLRKLPAGGKYVFGYHEPEHEHCVEGSLYCKDHIGQKDELDALLKMKFPTIGLEPKEPNEQKETKYVEHE